MLKICVPHYEKIYHMQPVNTWISLYRSIKSLLGELCKVYFLMLMLLLSEGN